MRFSRSVLLFFLLSSTTQAAPLPELMEALRDSAVNYEVVGTVCEQVARLELYKTFPAKDFEIINGIEYGDTKRTIGELDVVIFKKTTKKAVFVGEVKCWRDLQGALKKAHAQRNRFIASLSKEIYMQDQENSYDQAQFDHVQRYAAIAPVGSKKAGFDVEMENSLEELMRLRDMLMDCQHRGQCAAPKSNH